MKNGTGKLRVIRQEIISFFNAKEDSYLKKMVPGRKNNFHFMLNGLIRHNDYCLSQIVYLNKLFG
jgi:hypothetical protein